MAMYIRERKPRVVAVLVVVIVVVAPVDLLWAVSYDRHTGDDGWEVTFIFCVFCFLPVLCLSFSLSFFLSTLRFGGQVCECVTTVNQKSQHYLCPGMHSCISDLTIFVLVSYVLMLFWHSSYIF